jgi:hypothetical protein
MAEIQSRASLGTIWGQRQAWVQIGGKKYRNTKSEKREAMPRGSIRVSQVSNSVTHDSPLLVHVNISGPHNGENSADK